MAPLIFPEQPSRTKVIDLRCQTKCAHKVRLQTPLGPEIVHPVALVVQLVGEEKTGKIHNQGRMATVAGTDVAKTDIVLEEADRLLEEEGMVSSPLETTVEDQVEI